MIMNFAPRINGVLAPVVTPFRHDLSPDPLRLVDHCKWLVSQGCGLAIFGTNSEGNSLSTDERLDLLEMIISAGVDPIRMMPGTGCCALTDTVRLTAAATDAGCAGVLVLPPFYYKGVSDDGLYRSYAEVIERVGNSNLRIYLYHIPQVAVVGIPITVIERLLKDYPATIAGIKDSSGDWDHAKALLDTFRNSEFDVFVGSESFLLANMQSGGVGCISATANVNPAAIHRLYREWEEPEAAAEQVALDSVRSIVGRHGMIPSLKAVIAHFTHHEAWSIVRPPLEPLPPGQAAGVISGLEALGFAMPGISEFVSD